MSVESICNAVFREIQVQNEQKGEEALNCIEKRKRSRFTDPIRLLGAEDKKRGDEEQISTSRIH